jgi:hypothetical protein
MNDENRYIHDAYMSMAERTIRRLWILIILLVLILTLSNVGWVIYESQYQVVDCSDVDAMQNIKTDDNGNVTINDGVTVENGNNSSTESDSSQNKN